MVKKKVVSLMLVFMLAMSVVLGACSGGGNNNANGNQSGNGTSEQGGGSKNSGNDAPADEKPLKISLYYPDNATLPFKEDWLLIQEIQKRFNVDLDVEVIPLGEYQTKVSLALNTGTNVPDSAPAAANMPCTARRSAACRPSAARRFREDPPDIHPACARGLRAAFAAWPA